jgi:hypothetical protein
MTQCRWFYQIIGKRMVYQIHADHPQTNSLYIDPQLSAFGDESVAEEEEEVDGREEENDAIMQNDCTGVASGH